MKSPFPGVDPYLEAWGRWPDFHARFIYLCCDRLADLLPDPYVAQIEERIVLVEEFPEREKLTRPDVTIEYHPGPRGEARMAGGPITLEPVTIPFSFPVEVEVRERRIEVLHLPEQELVTVIELLSPANKAGKGAGVYEAKRLALLDQSTHLVELDLLTGGQRLRLRRPLPRADYFAFVARGDRRPDCDVYSWTIRDPLPTLPIPLLAPDRDVTIDLSAIFATAYERGRYDRLIDYAAPLATPLAPDDRAWAEELARTSQR